LNTIVVVLPFAIVVGSSIWSSMGYDFIELLFTSISSIVMSSVPVLVHSSVIFQMFGSVSSFAISYSVLFNFIFNVSVFVVVCVVVDDAVVVVVVLLVCWVVVVGFVDV